MAISTSQKSVRFGLGCLALFGLPFAAFGLGMAWWCAHIVLVHEDMRSWAEVPAVITSTHLKTNRGRKSTTYQAVASYEYEFEGRKFTGERVGADGGSDNIGTFQNDAYRELQRHLDPRKPFRCYANPREPSQAVLYRNLRGEMLAFNTVFATLFGSVGLGLMISALVVARRLPRASVELVPEDQPWLARDDWASGIIRGSGGAGGADHGGRGPVLEHRIAAAAV